MLSEERARELLGLAAGTIEVGPAEPLPTARHRRPRAVVAAAATALTIAASVAVGYALRTDPTDGTGPHPAVVGPAPEELPDSPQHYEIGTDRMPLLVGWQLDQARAELEERGLTVEVRRDASYGCQPLDRVMATEPSVALPIAAGDRVTLLLPPTRVHDCVGSGAPWDWEQAWRLIDFAEGRAPAPAFADEVTLWLGTRFSRTITAAEAKDPANWVVCSDNGVVCASALHDLVERKYFQMNEAPVQPYLEARQGAGSSLVAPSADGQDETHTVMPGRDALKISWQQPMDGRPSAPTIDVFRTGDPRTPDVRIDAVATWTGLNADGSAGLEVPDVTGTYGPEAKERIESAGMHPAPRRIDECDGPDGRVLATSPAPGELVMPGAEITLDLCRSESLVADGQAIAGRFVGLARSGDVDTTGLFADEVRLWLGNRKITTISGTQAATDPSAYDVCPPEGLYAEATCPFSAWQVIARADPQKIVYLATHPVLGACAVGASAARLPAWEFVAIGVAEPESCMDNWVVEVYHDEHGRIADVNLLHGSP